MAITIEQAKKLTIGTWLYSTRNKNYRGDPQRWKVTSVKTWKTRPNDVRIGLKHGLYDYDHIDQDELCLVCLNIDETI